MLILIACKVSGQAIESDSVSVGTIWTPTSLRISYDLIGPLQNAISRSRGGWEVTAEVDVNKFYLIGEYGNAHFSYGDTTYHYRSEGNYWRIGFDYNMIPRDEFESELFFGFRYAQSNFDEILYGYQRVPQYGYGLILGRNEGLTATWIEFTAGMKARVWKQLYMGYTLRLKISPGVSGEERIEPYRIPGYGVYSLNNFWGINYYVAWRFKFKEKYIRPRRISKE